MRIMGQKTGKHEKQTYDVNQNAGFSLLELLVALAILGVVVVPLLSAFLTSARVNASAKEKQAATTVAQNYVEGCKASGAESLRQAFGMENAEVGQTSFETSEEETIDGQVYTIEADLSGNATWNAKELSRLSSMESTSAGVYVQDVDQDQTYCSQLKGTEGSREEVLRGVRRDMDLLITEEKERVEVVLKTTYTWKATGAVQEAPSIRLFEGKAEDLEHIFLFYQPTYQSTAYEVNEVYTIENRDLVPVDVYLICQSPDAAKADTYFVQVRCAEKERSKAMWEDPYRAVTSIYSNLDSSRQTLQDKDKDERVGQAQFQYLAVPDSLSLKESSWSGANKYENLAAAEVLHYSDPSNKTASDHLYQLTVKVYKGSRDDHEDTCLASLTATLEIE